MRARRRRCRGSDTVVARCLHQRRASAETIMGLLVDGAWREDVPRAKNGHFVRAATAYHNYITPDGSPGPTGKGGFPAEAGRYHLYVSLACPWASRALIL